MSEKFYKSIDELPLYNWIKINEGELNYLLIDPKQKESEKKLNEAYEVIYDDFLKEFGVGKKQKEVFNEMKKLALLECDLVIKGDEFTKTKIEIQRAKLEQLKKGANRGMTTDKTLIYLSKWLGYKINAKETTVKEYYNILEEYGKANQK